MIDTMYQFLKKIVKLLLPSRLIFRIEPYLRKIYALFFTGNKYHFAVCDGAFSRFIRLENNENLCARCGSLSRDRRLFTILQNENKISGRMLDLSPSRSLYRKFKRANELEYWPSDYANEFLSDHQFDITAVPLSDNFFDSIICYHILEHIEDDRAAMKELFRVLKTGGALYVQTPFREGDILEDPSITSPEDRTTVFGQQDHVRIYSVAGLGERLQKAGFMVAVLHFIEQPLNKEGFSSIETVLRCKK